MSTPVFIAEPPEGIDRDVDERTSVQSRIMFDSSVTLSIACVILGCRLYSRLFITRSVALDDYVIIVAMLISVVFFICCLYEMEFGLGRHYWNVTRENGVKYRTLMIPTVISYFWCPMMTKISLLISFHRLSSAQYFRYLIYVVASIMIAYTVITSILVPATGLKPTVINDKSIYGVTMWQSILNISTDAIVLVLPTPSLWKMRLPFFQKLSVAIIISMGSLVIIASIIRIKYILVFQGELDFTYYQAATINLGAAELNCGVLCSCLTALNPFILHFFPSLKPTPSAADASTASSDRRGLKRFGTKGARMSYKLGYLGHKDLPDDNLTDTDGKPGIVVTNSYHVDIDEDAQNSRSESMENIIPAGLRDK